MPTPDFKLDQASARLADFAAEYSTESRLSWVGEKDAPDRASIVKRYADLFSREQVEAARSFYESAEEPELKDRARRLYFALLGMNISEQTVELGDRLDARLLGAKVEVDGETLPYYQAQAEVMHEDDFDRRERLSDGVHGVVERTNPLRREMLERELDLVGQWGYPGFVELIAEQKGIDYPSFRSKISDLYGRLEPLYLSSMREWVRGSLGRDFPGLRAVHASYLRGLPIYNSYFPADRLEGAATRSLGDLGLDLAQYHNIHIDVEDRPKKNPRAVCFTTRVPEEVHLIIKPTGTQHDYDAFFHEAGHALHFGLTSPKLPLELRQFSTSHALTEVYSYQVEALTRQPGWLVKYLGIPQETAREVARSIYQVDLMMLARYVGKLHYELDFFTDPLSDARNKELYSETLSRHSGFSYRSSGYLDDMDSGLYVADYLRAWITQAMMEEHLAREFGEGWYADSRTGEFLRELWVQGAAIENEDIATRLGYEKWDTGPLIRRYERYIKEPS